MVSLTAITSNSSDGQRFWLSATSPSCSASVVASRLGSRPSAPITSTSAHGSCGPAVTTPRRR